MELKTQRNSNIELLRIIAMVMIVAYHCANYGFFMEDVQYSSNKWIIDFLYSFGKVGVDIFVIITGYYMVEQSFRLKHILRFAGQVWFYSLCGLAAMLLVHGASLEKGKILQSLLPFSNLNYWFATRYLLLMFLAPAINTFIHNASRRLVQGTMAVLIITGLVLPTLFNKEGFFTPMCWFGLLYTTGAYIRIWRQDAGKPEKHLLWAILWAMTIPVYAWGGQYPLEADGAHRTVVRDFAA